jgi:septal ring factor EnvC (AmiA/AmiB activator)
LSEEHTVEVQTVDNQTVEVNTDVFTSAEHRLLSNRVRVIFWTAIILFVTAVISIIRSSQIQGGVSDLNVTVAEARDAAQHAEEVIDDKTDMLSGQIEEARAAAADARDTLKQALADFNENGEGSSPEEIKDALLAINRIEFYLCGGRCEDPQP